MSNRGDGDELAARRSARIIETARLAMVAAGEPAARAARANASVAKARRTLKRGAAELVAEGFVRGAPGPSCVPNGEIGWVDLGVCRAVTASGARCKAPATAEDGWCGQHRAVAARKAAMAATESGRRTEPAKARTGATAGRQRPEKAPAKAKAKTGRPGHSEPFRPFPGQCTGLNSKRKPCRLPALEGSDRCEHHPRVGP